jgi:hypothetical protein
MGVIGRPQNISTTVQRITLFSDRLLKSLAGCRNSLVFGNASKRMNKPTYTTVWKKIKIVACIARRSGPVAMARGVSRRTVDGMAAPMAKFTDR